MGVFHFDMRGVHKTRLPGKYVYVVPRKLRPCNIDFGLDDVLHDSSCHRFPHCLAGNGARIYTIAADRFAPLDEGNRLAPFSRLDGSSLARGTGAADDRIAALHLDMMVPF
jgi:hypothetical protein